MLGQRRGMPCCRGAVDRPLWGKALPLCPPAPAPMAPTLLSDSPPFCLYLCLYPSPCISLSCLSPFVLATPSSPAVCVPAPSGSLPAPALPSVLSVHVELFILPPPPSSGQTSFEVCNARAWWLSGHDTSPSVVWCDPRGPKMAWIGPRFYYYLKSLHLFCGLSA